MKCCNTCGERVLCTGCGLCGEEEKEAGKKS
jgi:hypothetical protein